MSLKNTLFTQWRFAEQQNAVIKTLWGVIALLVLLNGFAYIGWSHAPSQMRVYIPPNIDAGTWVKPGSIPDPTLYAFAYQIFTAINSWSDNGSDDYQNNIKAYRNYLSSRFYQALMTDAIHRQNNGSLNRKRLTGGVTGMGYQESRVTRLGNGTWRVDLRLQINETVAGSVVKDVVMDYPLIITRVNESIQLNPWGLVISGFSEPPTRIKTDV